MNLEKRPGQVMFAAAPIPSYWNLLDRYSSLKRLLRVTVTCRRFCNKLKEVPKSSPLQYPLTPTELQQSLKLLIGLIQKAWFLDELRIITRGEPLPKSNPLVHLTPFLDQDGLLRMGRRLQNAPIDSESQHTEKIPPSPH